jgi:hypothetical protein
MFLVATIKSYVGLETWYEP